MQIRKFNPQHTPKPPTPKIHFDQKNLELEIGCGDGEFSFNRAIQYSNKNIIAIEKTRNKIRRFQNRKNIPQNLWIVHTNAVWWVNHYAPPDSFSNIFILYPNVYKKKKQSNLRWCNRPFTSFLIERLKTEGCIEFRTNEEFYHQETKKKMLERFPFMECTQDERIPQNNTPQTTFERKYLEKMNCFILKFLKK